MMMENIKERLCRFKGEFIPHSDLPKRQANQIFEEMLDFEKRFASLIYLQRDQEKYL